jgi:GMP synthase PP-ATPase subunit
MYFEINILIYMYFLIFQVLFFTIINNFLSIYSLIKYFQILGDQMYTLNTDEDFSSYPISIRLIQAHTGLRGIFYKTSRVFIKIFQDITQRIKNIKKIIYIFLLNL